MSEKLDDFTMLLSFLCKRPMPLTGQETFMSVVSFLRGYFTAKESGIESENFEEFVEWLRQKFDSPPHWNWVQIINAEFPEDGESLKALLKLYLEFRELKKAI